MKTEWAMCSLKLSQNYIALTDYVSREVKFIKQKISGRIHYTNCNFQLNFYSYTKSQYYPLT